MSAGARGLARWSVGLPVAGAVVLVAACTPLLDDTGWAETVLRGAALLLALGVAAAVDEPDAKLLDASPTTFGRRVLHRLVVVGLVVVPLAAVAAWWAGRQVDLGAGRLALELAALVVVALAVSAALRRWTSVAEPAVLTGPLLLAGLLLGRWLAPYLPDTGLSGAQQWWLLLGVGGALLAAGLRDPATAARGLPHRA